jgi:hypothetical protein
MNFKSLNIIAFFWMLCLFSLQAKNWSWQDHQGKHIDLLFGDKKMARYVYEKMDPVDRQRTYKPFHHLFQSNGQDLLTKGPGGKFTHHRGIYFGFSKCAVKDGSGANINVDTWHCKRAYQTHEKILDQKASEKEASHQVEIAWRTDDGNIFATEHRTLHFSNRQDGSLQIDFQSKLSTSQEIVQLDGDPQHAGFQFRASNEVATKTSKKTYYIRSNDGKGAQGKTKNWPQDKDMSNLPWNAQSIVVGGNRYTTLYLDHPSNPKPSFYSERDYGRFGSYFKSEITPTAPLFIQYRLNLIKGERSKNECEKLSQYFFKGN